MSTIKAAKAAIASAHDDLVAARARRWIAWVWRRPDLKSWELEVELCEVRLAQLEGRLVELTRPVRVDPEFVLRDGGVRGYEPGAKPAARRAAKRALAKAERRLGAVEAKLEAFDL